MTHKPLLTLLFLLGAAATSFAQDTTDMMAGMKLDNPGKNYVTSTFKSPRIIMSHSVEMLHKGVLDFRILHRFGAINGGSYEFFGLDGPATVRLGLDYGISENFTVGIGRSSFNKEFDGFAKYRLVQQATGAHSSPVSLVVVGGATLVSLHDSILQKNFSSRLNYYGQLLIGRKFSEAFSLQLAPTILHMNLVPRKADKNDLFAIGTGGRLKISKRVSLNADYYIVANKNKSIKVYNPLSVGMDIETGGHVFQLHFTNAKGMNERAFVGQTEYDWGNGDIFFGFNISRSFQLRKKK